MADIWGLTEEEAQERLRSDGRNELAAEREKTVLASFLGQLNDPLIYVLLVAAVLSVLLKEFSDAVIIGVVVVLNAVVGMVQEGRAKKALEALKKLTSPKAVVIRDGVRREIPAAELVEGDVVCLEAGCQVPADLQLFHSSSLKVEESTLTGEALPVEKDADFVCGDIDSIPLGDRRNMAYMSTMVTYGRGEGIVTATGMRTEIGKIASLIRSAEEEMTPLQKRLGELGKVLSLLSLLLCGALFLLAVLQHRNVPEMLIVAISLAVAAVPEGLPAVVTICLALSVTKMVKAGTIIRRLPSVETLGAVDVVCSDKTGTLTQNRMTVERLVVDGNFIETLGIEGETRSAGQIRRQRDDGGKGSKLPETGREIGAAGLPADFLRAMALCNDAVVVSGRGGGRGRRVTNVGAGSAEEGNDERGAAGAGRMAAGGNDERGLDGAAERLGDPTELALLDCVISCGEEPERIRKEMPRLGELPFDSDRKMMTTFHRDERGIGISYTKGAPDVLLQRCSFVQTAKGAERMSESRRGQILGAVEELSAQAFRTLAVAMRRGVAEPAEEELTFLGLAAMCDPVREEAVEAVETFRRAGVKTVMITGDHVETAFAVGKQLGIAEDMEQCMTGEELRRLSQEELAERLDRQGIRVFARVSPEQKVLIVKGFKALGDVVAMTGDGVNDAPSLKAADIGVAMGRAGTDVAKQAADMILTDDNFATIEKAIEEGRGVYENIRKSVIFLLSSNLGEIMTMFAAVLLGLASPLKSAHILWINLITDSLPALALGVDKNDGGALMRHSPRKADESLFARGGLACTCFYGLLITAISLTALLMLPYAILRGQGVPFTLEHAARMLEHNAVLTKAQTYTFTVLGMSQLFHAVGMRDTGKSVFGMKHLENKLMIAACAVGLALQFAVTEVPFLIRAFGTSHLSLREWGVLTVLAAFPLLAHEGIVMAGKFLRDR